MFPLLNEVSKPLLQGNTMQEINKAFVFYNKGFVSESISFIDQKEPSI